MLKIKRIVLIKIDNKMKNKRIISVPSDLQYGDIIFVMSGEKLFEGINLYDMTPLFVKQCGEPLNSPGNFEVEACVGSANGERKTFRFASLNHHLPKKQAIGEIFLNEDDALDNLKAATANMKEKINNAYSTVNNLDELVQSMDTLVPVADSKSKTINIKSGKDTKEESKPSSQVTMDITVDTKK